METVIKLLKDVHDKHMKKGKVFENKKFSKLTKETVRKIMEIEYVMNLLSGYTMIVEGDVPTDVTREEYDKWYKTHVRIKLDG